MAGRPHFEASYAGDLQPQISLRTASIQQRRYSVGSGSDHSEITVAERGCGEAQPQFLRNVFPFEGPDLLRLGFATAALPYFQGAWVTLRNAYCCALAML